MHLLIIGASRGVGRKCVDEALARGHTVRAFSRSASDIPITDPEFEPYPGDATSPPDLTKAARGVHAVLLTLGIKESVSMIWKEVHLFSDATKALIPAMDAAGVGRLICLTGLGAGDSRTVYSKPERLGFNAILGKAYDDNSRQEALITASNLDYTLVRPTILTHNAKGPYKVLTDPKTWRNGVISRASVADFMVGAAEDGSYSRQAVVITR